MYEQSPQGQDTGQTRTVEARGGILPPDFDELLERLGRDARDRATRRSDGKP